MSSKAKSQRNTWGVLDSDDEDCCGGCSHAALPAKKKDLLDGDWLETQIVRRRFWPYPSEAEESEPSAWPCRSCAPWSCDEGAFWECEHGKWIWVESWESLPPLPEDHSLKECRNSSCTQHGLFGGEILGLYLAAEAGISWGDYIWMVEQAALAAETPAQKAARLAAEARKEAERALAIAVSEKKLAAELVKSRPAPQQRRYDRRTGKPMPCKFYCFQGVLGREHPAENGWEAGCGFHKKGKCEFFHPDEPEWQIIIGKAPMPSRPSTPEPEWRVAGGAGGPSRPMSGGGSSSSASFGPRGAGGGGFSRPSSGGGGSSRYSGGGSGRK